MVSPSLGAGSNVAATMAENAISATRAAGLKSNVVFVPRPSATMSQIEATSASGVVQPLYTGDPAPLGVAYYGLSGTGTGPLHGTVFNTTAVRGIVSANATGIQGQDLYQSSPDSYGIQLNSVMTNVHLFGTKGFEFWTQNVMEFYPAAGEMVLVTNIWNFSGGSYHGNEFYSQSVVGGAVDDFGEYGALGYYYAEYIVPMPISYPFNLTLTMNSGVDGGRNNMSFSVSLTSSTIPSEDFNLPNWDSIVFNSTEPLGTPLTYPSNYTADGLHYNPIGLTNDFELDICGPGGGSQVDLDAADASLGLAYYTGSGFASVPAAFSYGGETGETATGANVAWSNAAGGPGGLAEYGTATTGPGLLTGLWGTGAPEGSDAVDLAVSPGNAFNFLTYSGTVGFTTPIVAEAAYAPSMLTQTFYLMPGTYQLLTELADYALVNQSISVAGPMTVPVSLSSDMAAGVYTPLWAFSNAEVASLAQSGAGTPSSPYILDNNQLAPLSSSFGLYNDYVFPVYPGVFLYGTTVTVELYHAPSFQTSTSTFQYPGQYLPQYNDLQFWFWGVTGASIVDAANISGWFGGNAFYPLVFDTFNVIFYESGGNLVAGNTFDTPGEALLMFAGGGVFYPPLNIGGGNNTVWGNTFNEVNNPAGCVDTSPCLGLMSPAFGVAVEIGESNDVVYNNYVNTPTTAWLLPLNLYSGYPDFFAGTEWNITPQPATNVHFASGFPTLPLTGSIIGGTTQGGNFWWDYGLIANPYNGADNPYGVLPYDENAITLVIEIYGPSYYYLSYIYGGGDYAPLVPTLGPAVTFVEHGLVPGTMWGADVNVGGLEVGFETTSNFETLSVFGAPGHYVWFAAPPPIGYTSHSTGTVRLTDHPITVGVVFHVAPGYSLLKVRESGLPSGSAWSVVVNGTTPATDAFNTTATTNSSSVTVLVFDGTYDFTVPSVPGYFPSPSSGSLAITGGTTLHVRFHIVTYALVFSETGIPAGRSWSVRITGPVTGGRTVTRTLSSRGSSITFEVPNGTYSYTILPGAHTVCVPNTGSQAISGAGATVTTICVYSGGHVPAHPLVVSGGSAAALVRLAAVRGPSA
ncbi:MAG: thermopsin family protease [Thermoplasmata archaeon]